MNYFLIFLFSYLFGAIPFGLLIGWSQGKDIRKEGSGNIGATNVTRVVGKTAGRICFALDFLKGMLPVMAAARIMGSADGLALLLAGAAAVAGHMYPVYLKFKGGKGISTAAGVTVALAPGALIFAGTVWVVTFFISRYVSLASILAAAMLPVAATGIYFWRGGMSPLVLVFFYLIGVVAILKHRSNIERLRNGTELRFGGKPKGK